VRNNAAIENKGKIPAINKHLKNVFDAGELEEKTVISKMEITANDGKLKSG